jgi:hypothetical protein
MAVANIPVDIRDAPLGDALAAIYEAVLAQSTRIEALEISVTELSGAFDRLDSNVTTLLARVGQDAQELQAALEAERAANATLVQAALDTAAAEDAEDAEQNTALESERAARDAAVAEVDAAFGRVTDTNSRLEAALNPVTPEEPPVDPNA